MKIKKLKESRQWGCGQCFNEGHNFNSPEDIYRVVFDNSERYLLQLCKTHLKQLAEIIISELIDQGESE